MEQFFSVIYLIITFGLLIWTIGLYFSEPRRKYYFKYGIIFSIVFIVIEIVLFILIPSLIDEFSFYLIIVDIIAFFKIIAFVVVGMIMTNKVGLVSIPLTRQLLTKSKRLYVSNYREYFIKLFSALILILLFSIVLFKLTNPKISEFLSNQQNGLLKQGFTDEITFATLLALVQIAFVEEIVFRLGIQNVLANFINHKNKYLIAIILTSLIWTLGHVMSLEPAWIKLVQIFPIGIILGFLYKKYGLEMCIFIHGAFNVILTLLASNLIEGI